jgi:hypothetical protein
MRLEYAQGRQFAKAFGARFSEKFARKVSLRGTILPERTCGLRNPAVNLRICAIHLDLVTILRRAVADS